MSPRTARLGSFKPKVASISRQAFSGSPMLSIRIQGAAAPNLLCRGFDGHHICVARGKEVPEILPPCLKRGALLGEVFVPIVNTSHRTVRVVQHTSDDEAQ